MILADTSTDTLGFAGKLGADIGLNSAWVMVAAVLVMFMQAGFAMLEIGFVRGKNAGSVVAKVLVNFALAALGFWAVGFALAFGGTGDLIGTHGWLVLDAASFPLAFPTNQHGVTAETLWFFEFVFCAVALAIVWGTTLERIKFGVYIIYALVFSAFIYPVVAHWIFGGGWLASTVHVQDFAGSIVVDVCGAAAGLAILLQLGPRRGKYAGDGSPRAIPGHSMPLFGLGVLILWFGWFGFNPGSELGALDGRFPTIAMITQLAGSSGVAMAMVVMYAKTKTFDIGMAGNGAIAGLVAVTGPAGYIEPWAAPIIGGVAGIIVVYGVLAIDRHLDDPVGALAAHGLAGAWGALACGLFAAPRLAEHNLPGSHGGLFLTGSFTQLGSQIVGVAVVVAFTFTVSYALFYVIAKTYGLRVSPQEENAGLDISEHGMYGYPEQFIPAPELVGYGASTPGQRFGTGPMSDPEVTVN
ncbi:ammonium transporter [Baekduia sp. Peel2402]|uniref:ammonium transporter n=1 Tax=Baekduia sp. Peel2402 TaxID=3458296 RepID=UPI00403EED31